MILAYAIACLALPQRLSRGLRAVQDPKDSLLFAPGLYVGARLQFGENIFPSDWVKNGTLTEKSAEDDGLPGFHILTLLRPAQEPNRPSSTDGFREIPCDFIGTTPVVSVFSQDGAKHRFTIDSGAIHTYMRGTLAQGLNFARSDPLPFCLYLPNDKWVHFKAEVNRSISVLATPNPDFPVDGILGMNALSCLQLKIDYKLRKIWARVSAKPLDSRVAAAELSAKVPLITIPIKRQDSGRYSVDVNIGGKSVPLEVDTGANLLGVAPSMIASLTLEKVGEGQVLVQSGSRPLSKFLAPEASIGEIHWLWPVVHEGADRRAELGGFGPAVLPHPSVIIDYPGKTLYTLKPTDNELIEQALGQLISGVVRIQPEGVILDMPDIVGSSKAILTKIQDQPTAAVLKDLRLWNKGNIAARARLLSLFRDLSSPNAKITILQDGAEETIQIGKGG